MERLTRSEACKILGVPESAHSAKIRQRFRFLSHAYHPDKFPDEAQKRLAEEEFKRILDTSIPQKSSKNLENQGVLAL